ncbi:hypothetical protein [Acetobacter conturbans]|uniref:Uncharacterized protein n=1 Tax=Acetobacter conturbans TaxID=1737472 RepID=A0ABX0K0E6_9PROT|nr:hypothetical protein [Acetobacter conturbans]NHN89192.1 hypothetical protein [Acetobacter conturbans]
MSSFLSDLSSVPSAISSQVIITDGVGNSFIPQHVRVTQSRMAEASTFEATLSLAQTLQTIPLFDSGATVSIYVGVSETGKIEDYSKTKIFSGGVDKSRFNVSDRTLRMWGRDWSSKLISYELAGHSFLNMTGSDAISYLAEQVGLEADVDSTTGFIGQFYQYEHKAHGLSGMHRYQTAWDLCVGIQRDYGYDLWVDDQTLHFKQPDTSTNLISLTWNGNNGSQNFSSGPILDLTLSHDLLYADSIYVVISSWDARQKITHTASYPEGVTTGQAFNFTAPVGTTTDQCKILAQQRYSEIVAHGKTVEIHLHPSVSVSTRQLVKLTGTNTSFDSVVYTVDQVVIDCTDNSISKAVLTRPR